MNKDIYVYATHIKFLSPTTLNTIYSLDNIPTTTYNYLKSGISSVGGTPFRNVNGGGRFETYIPDHKYLFDIN